MSDLTNNYKRNISANADSLKVIANAVSTKIRRRLQANEIDDLIAFIDKNAVRNWSNMKISEVRVALARTYLQSRFTVEGRQRLNEDIIDVHEVLKSHIGTQDQEPDYESVDNVNSNGVPTVLEGSHNADDVGVAEAKDGSLGSIDNINTITRVAQVATLGNIQGFLGKTDDTSLQQMLNPQAAWRKNYIVLDTRYKKDDGNTFNLSWDFLANSSNNVSGGVNSIGDVQQVVSVSCPPLRIPYTETIFQNSYRRITMLITEFSGQSFIGQEGRKYHFIFSAKLGDGNMIDLEPLMGDGMATFEFAKPITQLDTLTVSFGNPLEPIIFDQDSMLMEIQYNNPISLTSVMEHKLQTGDQIYLSGFTTGDLLVDAAIIAKLNSQTGHNVVVIDDYTVQINDIDMTAVTAPISPLSIPVYFGSKRIFIPLEIKYISTVPKSLQ